MSKSAVALEQGILETIVTVSALNARRLRANLLAALTGCEGLEAYVQIHDAMHERIDMNADAQIQLISLEDGGFCEL